MRSLFWLLPSLAIPVVCLQLSSGQPSSTATVNIRSTPTQPLPPLALLPEITPVAPTVSADHPSTSAKKQPQKVITPKHPLKAKPESSKNKAITRPYTAPAIEIRVRVAHSVSSIAIASSTVANIIDGNGKSLEPLPPSEAVQISAHNSTILFQNWQVPSSLWIEPSDVEPYSSAIAGTEGSCY